ncbi:jg20446 [Pararge aegeria aegeria]|uniref:Jg20446 protein n=1 Tax=Pararge aegeria aegeria TaxID=348720 RepID=A0A8S4RZ10_9NEOP|nr:jg20446 [Pararge aegeria aegeria]
MAYKPTDKVYRVNTVPLIDFAFLHDLAQKPIRASHCRDEDSEVDRGVTRLDKVRNKPILKKLSETRLRLDEEYVRKRCNNLNTKESYLVD